jgi:hypothetical protein
MKFQRSGWEKQHSGPAPNTIVSFPQGLDNDRRYSERPAADGYVQKAYHISADALNAYKTSAEPTNRTFLSKIQTLKSKHAVSFLHADYFCCTKTLEHHWPFNPWSGQIPKCNKITYIMGGKYGEVTLTQFTWPRQTCTTVSLKIEDEGPELLPSIVETAEEMLASSQRHGNSGRYGIKPDLHWQASVGKSNSEVVSLEGLRVLPSEGSSSS